MGPAQKGYLLHFDQGYSKEAVAALSWLLWLLVVSADVTPRRRTNGTPKVVNRKSNVFANGHTTCHSNNYGTTYCYSRASK
jgi:hypothetical protein